MIGQVDMFHSVPATTQSGRFYPTGVAVDGSGNLYIADFENDRLVLVLNGCRLQNENSG